MRTFMASFITMLLIVGVLLAMPEPVSACTVTPSPTPTATPDANGYIPPTPTPRPTAPARDRVAYKATYSAVIIEGAIVMPTLMPTVSYMDFQPGRAAVMVDKTYRADVDDILEFSYYPEPCTGQQPEFYRTPEAVFFFREDGNNGYFYMGQLPADEDVRQSLAIVVGPGKQQHSISRLAMSVIVLAVGGSLFFVWRWLHSRLSERD